MRPLAFLIGIIFGSALALSLGLGFVVLFALVRQNAYPELASELPSLLVGGAGSVLLMAVAGLSLWLSMDDPRHAALLKYRPWAYLALTVALCLWFGWLLSLR